MDKMSTNAISRRGFLTIAAVGVGGAVVLSTGLATEAEAGTIPPSAVHYQTTPKGNQRCDNCALFQAPSSCKFVAGTIASSGWCTLFKAK